VLDWLLWLVIELLMRMGLIWRETWRPLYYLPTGFLLHPPRASLVDDQGQYEC
jgi:hypothetical protein